MQKDCPDCEDKSDDLPLMYRRQPEIATGEPVFHSTRERTGRRENPELAKRKAKMAKVRRVGQILMVANFVTLIVLFTVFKVGDTSQTGGADFTLASRAVEFDGKLLVSMKAVMKQAGDSSELVDVWYWLGDDQALPKPEDVQVPPEAAHFVDVMPETPGQERLWREELVSPPGTDLEKSRLLVLIEYRGKRYLTQSRISKE